MVATPTQKFRMNMARKGGKGLVSKKQFLAPEENTVARYVRLYELGMKRPTSEAEEQELLSEYQLKHGDVVSFSDYRDTSSYIVFRREDGNLTLLGNPDDRQAGYLTIPKEVLADIKDAVAFYKDLIHSDQPSLNLHLSPQDAFVVDRLGQVPDSWEFNVWWDWGELDSIDTKVPGFDLDHFKPDAFNRQTIEERYLSGSPIVSVTVRVQLQGEEYHRYIAKYGDTYSHSPSVPPGWLMAGDSSGGSHIGTDYASWGWRFHGPESKKQGVVNNIKDFFEGFNYHLH